MNLVEAAFLPGGDAIGTDNWFQEPAGGFRDALVHLVEGGLYPYVAGRRDAPADHRRVRCRPSPGSRPSPSAAWFATAATAYPGRVPGKSVLGPAQRAAGRPPRPRPGRIDFRSEDSDFLTSDDPDFHPSDVLEDADGSLLVIDTGAWYVQHCPTGRIRAVAVARRDLPRPAGGGPRPDDPRGLGLDWAGLPVGRLAELLADPRPRRARSGRPRVDRPRLRRDRPARGIVRGPATVGKVEAVWALAAIAGPGRAGGRCGRPSPTRTRRWPARPLGPWQGGPTAAPRRDLIRLLSTGRPRAQLAAAEALARCGGPEIAARRLARPGRRTGPVPQPRLGPRRPPTRRRRGLGSGPGPSGAGCSGGGAAAPGPAAPAPGPAWPRPGRGSVGFAGRGPSRRTPCGVLMRHPEWSGEALDHIRRRLRAADPDERPPLAELVLAFQDRADVQELLAGVAIDATAPADRRVWALKTMSRSRLAPAAGGLGAAPSPASIRGAEPSVRRAAVRRGRRPASSPGWTRPCSRSPTTGRAARPAAGGPPGGPAAPGAFPRRLRSADRPARRRAMTRSRRWRRASWRAGPDWTIRRRLRLLDAVRGQALIAPPMLRAAFAPPVGRQGLGGWVDYLEASLRAGWRPSEADLRALLEAVPTSRTRRRSALLRVNGGEPTRPAGPAGRVSSRC